VISGTFPFSFARSGLLLNTAVTLAELYQPKTLPLHQRRVSSHQK
jgi:hypothetical protein